MGFASVAETRVREARRQRLTGLLIPKPGLKLFPLRKACPEPVFQGRKPSYQVSTARMPGGPGWPSMTCVSMTASIFNCSQLDGSFAINESR